MEVIMKILIYSNGLVTSLIARIVQSFQHKTFSNRLLAVLCLLGFTGCGGKASPPYPDGIPNSIELANVERTKPDQDCPITIVPAGFDAVEDGLYVYLLITGAIDKDQLQTFASELGQYASTDSPSSVIEVRRLDGDKIKLNRMRVPRDWYPTFVVPSFRSPPGELVRSEGGVHTIIQALMFRTPGRVDDLEIEARLTLDEGDLSYASPVKYCVDGRWRTIRAQAELENQ
jgi:hypothetical protein